MKHITEVREALLTVFDGLVDGSVDPKHAFEVNNTAGKIISSAKVQLAYHALRGDTPNIPFLDSPVDVPKIPGDEAKQMIK